MPFLCRPLATVLLVAIVLATAASLPLEPTVAAQTPAAPQDKRPLTNADIIHMVKSGLAEVVVISAIEANNSSFDVSADALIALKQAGVSQNIITSMLAAESRRRTGLIQPPATGPTHPGQTAPPEAPLRALLIQGGERLPLTLNTTARPALVKSNENDLKSIAANQVVGAAIIAGSMQAGAAIASATGSLRSLGIIGTAGSIVGGRLFGKKPTHTVVFAVAGRSAQAVIYNTQPTFEVVYQDIPGVNPDGYEPALVRLFPTSDNYRIFSAVKLKDGKQLTPRPLVEQVPTQTQKIGRGHTQIIATRPLEAGEYGLLLLPVDTQASSRDGALFTQSEESISLLVWDFSIAPAGNQLPQPNQAEPQVQPLQPPGSRPETAPTASPVVRQEPIANPPAIKAPAGSVAFQTSVAYEAAYDRILNVLKKEGYTLHSASKETGQITTELAIEHGSVDIGRAVIISLIKESSGLTTVQVTAYNQGRRIGGQWQEKVYTKDKAALLAEKLRAALQGSS
jgi:hypothetical protein